MGELVEDELLFHKIVYPRYCLPSNVF